VAVPKSVTERRKYERVPLAVPIFVRGTDSEGKEFVEFATALNVSAGGALLAIRRYLPKFAMISLEIPSAPVPRTPDLPRAVRRLQARLLRATTLEGYQLWGMKFSTPLISHSMNGRRKLHSVG
jgi:hypothetical protein